MRDYLTLRQRLFALSIYILSLSFVCRVITGVWIPPSGGKSLWFFSSIALWFFTRLSAPFFVRPRDAVARSAVAALQLGVIDLTTVTAFKEELDWFRWFALGITSLTSIIGVTAIVLHQRDRNAGRMQSYFSRVTYRLAERFGRGQIVFTPLVLISVLGFYQNNLIQQLWLIFFWSILIFVQPVELVLHIVGDLRKAQLAEQEDRSIGEIQRIDYPNIVRVKLKSVTTWTRDNIHAACLADSRQVEVLPLFVQTQNTELIGTGICHTELEQSAELAIPGRVFFTSNARKREELMSELSGGGADLIGFVVENSTISRIQFEVSAAVSLREGAVVTVLEKDKLVPEQDKRVYYQILDASTDEESFSQNPLGRHIASAEQLGVFNPETGFVKYGWLPTMNSPVFLLDRITRLPTVLGEDEFVIGTVPYSRIEIGAKLKDIAEYHTAILGVTGTGKTELAFDMIRFALARGFKVFCVDFTAEYEQRLKDLAPLILELEESDSSELRDKLFDVETGEYGAGAEKIALKNAVDELKPKVVAQIKSFLEPAEPTLGILKLDEIANTRATLRLTEMYLSSIFDWAREFRRSRRILIVLEEAHTIVPEMSLYGRFDRTETEAVLGRMSQIALQGRKYGVGLLLISQRTALVSKTLLSQCNTVLSFGMHDETGLKYLANVFSTDHVSAIPNLKRFQVIAFGKGIKSERPVIFEIAEDPEKQKASELLNKKWEASERTSALSQDESHGQESGQLRSGGQESPQWEDDDV